MLDAKERVRMARARFEMWGGRIPITDRYGTHPGHDVSGQPRDDHGRWSRLGTIRRKKKKSRIVLCSSSFAAHGSGDEKSLRPAPSQSTPTPTPPVDSQVQSTPHGTVQKPPEPQPQAQANPQSQNQGQIQTQPPKEPELTPEQRQELVRNQAEIARLQEGVRNFERDLKNPNLSPGFRRSLERGLAECRENLRKLIHETYGVAAIGEAANGKSPVANMTMVRKLEMAIRLAISSGQFSEDVKAKLEELLAPENLVKMAAFFGGYAALHATPLAPFLAVADAYMLGSSATEAANALFEAYLALDSATTPKELEQASKTLSQLLAGPVVDALMKVVIRGATKGAKAFNKNYKISVKIDPTTLGMNLGNVKLSITKRPPAARSKPTRKGTETKPLKPKQTQETSGQTNSAKKNDGKAKPSKFNQSRKTQGQPKPKPQRKQKGQSQAKPSKPKQPKGTSRPKNGAAKSKPTTKTTRRKNKTTGPTTTKLARTKNRHRPPGNKPKVASGANRPKPVKKNLKKAKRPGFQGYLKGVRITLPGVKTKKIIFTKAQRALSEAARKKFHSTERSAFLKWLASDAKRVEQLRRAGITEPQIAAMKEHGRVPHTHQVHHKLPLDAGGSNAFSNLTLIAKDPYHKVITNHHNAHTRDLTPGESKSLHFPFPDGFVYPPKQ